MRFASAPTTATSPQHLYSLSEYSFSDMGARVWAEQHPGILVHNVGTIEQVWGYVRSRNMGVIPIENSAAFMPVVGDHLETMWQTACAIRGQVQQTIEMCLAGSDPQALRRLDGSGGKGFTLYSHPKALDQCKVRLDRWPQLKKVETGSTVRGLEMIAGLKDLGLASRAAIESEKFRAKCIKLLDPGMANLPPEHNKTELCIVEGGTVQEAPDSTKENHAFILIPENKPGVLHDITGLLRDTCDLLRIDSFRVDPHHVGFFLPLRRQEQASPAAFEKAMQSLYRYPPLRDSHFQTLQMLAQKKEKFAKERQRSVVCLGSWSDADMIKN